MDKMKDFFENLVENHLGAMIAAILVFVALIAGAIVLSLKINRRKKERAEREYKEELSRISKEELDNIAGNVSNPEVLYKSFETAETKPLADDDNGKAESEEATASPSSEIEPAAPADESANYSTTSVKDETPDDKSSEAANETNPAHAESKEGKTEAEPAPQEIKATNEPSKPAPSAKTAAKSTSKSTAKPTAKTAATKSATAKSDKPINAKPTAASKPTKAANPTAKTDGNKATNKPAATSVTKTADANKVAAASTKPAKAAPVEQKPAQAHKQAYAGKWVIVKGEDGKYYAKLLASNGGVLLRTENYSSLSGVKNGIQTIKKNVDGGNFATSIDKYGHYCFKLFSMSNRLICQSEDYSSKAKCENGINSVKRFAKTDLIMNEID